SIEQRRRQQHRGRDYESLHGSPFRLCDTNVTQAQRLSMAGAMNAQRSPLRLAVAFPAASGWRNSTRGGSALTVPEVVIATAPTVPALRYVTSWPLRPQPQDRGPPAPSVVNFSFSDAGPTAILSAS